MARFLLIHGSCHGAWCWRDLVPLLAAAGHEVRAIDLPAHGSDASPAAAVAATLEGYVGAILSAIAEPVVLVGHSLGGMWITAAAEAAPGKIDRLVYLTAWCPTDGQAASDLRRAANADLLMQATEVSADGVTMTYRDDMVEALFYHDCPPGTVEHARANLVPEPVAPTRAPVRVGAACASVRRHYVRCLDDRAIPAEHQKIMSRDWPAGTVHDLPCGHSPFFAMPDRLARLLSEIAERP